MDLWTVLAFLAIGFAAGVFVGAKYINTPTTEYHLGKIKIKGENTITAPEINFRKPDEAEVVKEHKGLIKRILKRNKNAKTIE